MKTQMLGDHAGPGGLALIFRTDDPVIETLERFAEERGIRAAHFHALGAFRQATLAYFDWESREYREIPVAEQVEVASLIGDIARKDEDDTVVVHAHCVLGRADGSTVAGHLVEGRVRPTLELFMVTGPNPLVRSHDPDSTLHLIGTGD